MRPPSPITSVALTVFVAALLLVAVSLSGGGPANAATPHWLNARSTPESDVFWLGGCPCPPILELNTTETNYETASQSNIALNTAAPKVLLFDKIDPVLGWPHHPFQETRDGISQLGDENGFEVHATNDSSQFTDENLAQYDAIIFAHTHFDVLNPDQEDAFQRYIQAGGGFAGIHLASATEKGWKWFGDLVGARFLDHPPIQQATVIVEDSNHPSTKDLPSQWVRTDEWYDFDPAPDRSKVNVLLTVDESTYNNDGIHGDDHPIAWYHEFDGGRSWYTAMGHIGSHYEDPLFLSHLLGGIQYAMDIESPPPPEVTLPFRANAGGSAYSDSGGNNWLADQPYSGNTAWGYVDSSPPGDSHEAGGDIQGTEDDPLYTSERWGMDGYRINVPNGTYDLRLHLAETFDLINSSGQRVFDVMVEGTVAFDNLDVFDEVGQRTALVKQLPGVEVSDSRLDIQFFSVIEQPMIKGIEIFSADFEPTPVPTVQPTATATPPPTTTPNPSPTAVATATSAPPPPLPPPPPPPQPAPTATPGIILIAPSQPQNISVIPGDGQLTLTWNEPASDGGSPILQYRIFNITTSTATTVSATQTSHVVTDLMNGVDYSFQISAINVVGTGQSALIGPVSPAPLELTEEELAQEAAKNAFGQDTQIISLDLLTGTDESGIRTIIPATGVIEGQVSVGEFDIETDLLIVDTDEAGTGTANLRLTEEATVTGPVKVTGTSDGIQIRFQDAKLKFDPMIDELEIAVIDALVGRPTVSFDVVVTALMPDSFVTATFSSTLPSELSLGTVGTGTTSNLASSDLVIAYVVSVNENRLEGLSDNTVSMTVGKDWYQAQSSTGKAFLIVKINDDGRVFPEDSTCLETEDAYTCSATFVGEAGGFSQFVLAAVTVPPINPTPTPQQLPTPTSTPTPSPAFNQPGPPPTTQPTSTPGQPTNTPVIVTPTSSIPTATPTSGATATAVPQVTVTPISGGGIGTGGGVPWLPVLIGSGAILLLAVIVLRSGAGMLRRQS